LPLIVVYKAVAVGAQGDALLDFFHRSFEPLALHQLVDCVLGWCTVDVMKVDEHGVLYAAVMACKRGLEGVPFVFC
jgi:hypothetical protein